MKRQFRWLSAPGYVGTIHHLTCVSDPAPCRENPCGRQIVAEITMERERYGRQKHRFNVRVYWDRDDAGRDHAQGEYKHNSAIIGSVRGAKAWAETWLDRCVWPWDACEVIACTR